MLPMNENIYKKLVKSGNSFKSEKKGRPNLSLLAQTVWKWQPVEVKVCKRIWKHTFPYHGFNWLPFQLWGLNYAKYFQTLPISKKLINRESYSNQCKSTKFSIFSKFRSQGATHHKFVTSALILTLVNKGNGTVTHKRSQTKGIQFSPCITSSYNQNPQEFRTVCWVMSLKHWTSSCTTT